jgi:hypothetical protein
LVSLVIKTFGKVLNGKPCRAYADMRCVGRSKIFLQTFPLMYRYLLTFSVIFVNLATFLLFIPRHSDIFADYQDNLPINPKTICRVNQTFAESTRHLPSLWLMGARCYTPHTPLWLRPWLHQTFYRPVIIIPTVTHVVKIQRWMTKLDDLWD